MTGRAGVTLRSLAYLLLIILFPACPLFAEEIFVGGGFAVNTDSGTTSSQGHWSLAYFQKITDHAMFSITYLNEGHQNVNTTEHARDGFAPQVWLRTVPSGPSKVSFALGAGPYLYFDTLTSDTERCDFLHDLAVISSASATWYGLSPFLLQARLNYVFSWNNFNTLSGSVGIGYLLEDPGKQASKNVVDGKNEIDLYVGRTVLNSDNSTGTAVSLEYRRELSRYFDWSIAGLHEGNDRPVGRYGILSELWLKQDFYNDRLSLGVGAGPYFAHDRYSDDDTPRDTIALAISLTAAWRFTPHIGFRGMYHRIATDYCNDADVIMGGLAISF